MAEAGAMRFKKTIQRIQQTGDTRTVQITLQTSDLLRVEKRTIGPEIRIEFSFLVRIEHTCGRELWWPIEYSSISGETIACEKLINGKTMVNLARQDQLIDIAETWAKTLEAQKITKEVSNALR